jgi:adenylate cyclase
MNEVSKHATILLIDLADYTSRTVESTREQLIKLQDTFDELVTPIIPENKGSIIKKMGDAFLCSFESPTNAVKCAEKLQKRFKLHRLKHRKKMHIRAVLHCGEVLFKDSDVYGSTVNLCARIEKITPKDEIYFSAPLLQSVNKNEISVKYVGSYLFKGFNKKMRIYKVKTLKDVNNKFFKNVKQSVIIVSASAIIFFSTKYVIENINVLQTLI